MNLVIHKGNITRDLELRFTPKGTAVLEIGIAINRKWRNEAGEMQEEVTFCDWTAWGKQAETMAKHFSKGAPILLQGRTTQESWEDKASGQKRSKTKFVVESFEFCGGSKREAAEPPAGHPATRPRAASPAQPSAEGPITEGMEEDDIPF